MVYLSIKPLSQCTDNKLFEKTLDERLAKLSFWEKFGIALATLTVVGSIPAFLYYKDRAETRKETITEHKQKYISIYNKKIARLNVTAEEAQLFFSIGRLFEKHGISLQPDQANQGVILPANNHPANASAARESSQPVVEPNPSPSENTRPASRSISNNEPVELTEEETTILKSIFGEDEESWNIDEAYPALQEVQTYIKNTTVQGDQEAPERTVYFQGKPTQSLEDLLARLPKSAKSSQKTALIQACNILFEEEFERLKELTPQSSTQTKLKLVGEPLKIFISETSTQIRITGEGKAALVSANPQEAAEIQVASRLKSTPYKIMHNKKLNLSGVSAKLRPRERTINLPSGSE